LLSLNNFAAKEVEQMKSILLNQSIKAGLAIVIVSLLASQGFSQDPNFLIFLAFGQSNMEGNAQPQSQDKTDVNERFRLLPAVNWPDNSRTKGTWTTAVPPLCRSSTGLNPCDYFGRTLVDSLPDTFKIGIINVSVAGCAIDMFDKDKYANYISGEASWMKEIAALYDGNPYGRLVEMARIAQNDGVIRGILLHQGETDAYKGGWPAKVKAVYDDLIDDLSLDASKTPLIAGDLLSPSSAVQSLPETLENSYVISSSGLNGSDQYHFTADSYREFGKRYGLKMFEILKEQGLTDVNRSNKENSANAGLILNNSVEFRKGTASVSFEIPRSSYVSVKVFTLGGKQVADLAGKEFSQGKHVLEFGQKVKQNGVFVIRMRSGSFSDARTVVIAER